MLLKQRKGQWNEKDQTEKLPVKIKNQPPLEGGVPPLYILVRRIRRIMCFGKTCARRKKNSKYFRKNRVDLWAIDVSVYIYNMLAVGHRIVWLNNYNLYLASVGLYCMLSLAVVQRNGSLDNHNYAW